MAYDKKNWKEYMLRVPIPLFDEITTFQRDLEIDHRVANRLEATRELISKGLEMVKIEKELEKSNLTIDDLIEILNKEK